MARRLQTGICRCHGVEDADRSLGHGLSVSEGALEDGCGWAKDWR